MNYIRDQCKSKAWDLSLALTAHQRCTGVASESDSFPLVCWLPLMLDTAGHSLSDLPNPFLPEFMLYFLSLLPLIMQLSYTFVTCP